MVYLKLALISQIILTFSLLAQPDWVKNNGKSIKINDIEYLSGFGISSLKNLEEKE